MKPGKRRQKKENAGKLSRRWTEPIHCHLVDHNCHAAAGQNAQDNQRQVGIMKQNVQEPAETYIQEIPRWMRLMDAGIKTLHGQRKIDGIQVVEVTTAKHEASDGNRAGQKHQAHLLPISHT